jgi:RimJ/RimL family protein N-acetyltransferase
MEKLFVQIIHPVGYFFFNIWKYIKSKRSKFIHFSSFSTTASQSLLLKLTKKMAVSTGTIYTRESTKCMGPYTVSAQDPSLYLSAVEFTDIPEMVRILNINKDVYNGSAIFQYPYLESHAQDRIQKAHDTAAAIGINTHWAMRATPEGPLIGWAHLHFDHYDENHPQPVHPVTGKPLTSADIGYWLSPEHTGKGLAARVGRFLVDQIALKEMECDIVRAVSYTGNWASRKVAERAGMELELEKLSILVPKLGDWKDICTYAVHKDPATKGIIKTEFNY